MHFPLSIATIVAVCGGAAIMPMVDAAPLAKTVSMPIRRYYGELGSTHKNQKRVSAASAALTNDVQYYLIDMQVGTPQKPFVVTIDTGSSETWVNGKSAFCQDSDNGCASYGIYSPSASSSYKYLNDNFNITYMDYLYGKGEFVSETLSVAGLTLRDYTLGVANDSTSAMGYMGLGFPGLERTMFYNDPPYEYPNLLVSLKNAGLINRAAFSLYLNDIDASQGTLLFGGYDTEKFDGPLHRLPIINSKTRYDVPKAIEYTVNVTSISLNGKPFGMGSVAALFDSGYSYTAFTPDVYSSLVLEFYNATWSDYYYGYVRSCNFDKINEEISFEFATGYKFTVKADQFLIPAGDPDNTCVLSIMTSGQDDRMILGDSFLRAAYVLYDQDKYQISIAPARLDVKTSNIVTLGKPSACSRN